MRAVKAEKIESAVAELYKKAACELPEDVRTALASAYERETWPSARDVLSQLLENAKIAGAERIPICQDTGMACVFLELGQDVHIEGGGLSEAVNKGVARACREGYLRASVVRDPLRRVNTLDNTPALLHTDVVPGEDIRITVAPKGFGSENMSKLRMLRPSDGEAGVRAFILEAVESAGACACPPMVVGVGIGGSFDMAALLAKKALLRPLDIPNADGYYAQMERELTDKINSLGVGPAGFGGAVTAIGVNIETCPTHIAGLPVAVNMSCHATRRASAVI